MGILSFFSCQVLVREFLNHLDRCVIPGKFRTCLQALIHIISLIILEV